MDEPGLTPRVATDRYRKKIREEDHDRGDANYGKSAAVGALVGALLRSKRLSLGGRAAIGAGAGLLAQGAIRAHGESSKDVFGERSRLAKKSEKLPIVGGLTAAAIIGLRRTSAYQKRLAGKVAFDRRFELAARLGLNGWTGPIHHLDRTFFGAEFSTGTGYGTQRLRTGIIRPVSRLKSKLMIGASLAGGIAIADAATSAVFPSLTAGEDVSRTRSAAEGLKRGAVYGSALAGIEPFIHGRLVRAARKIRLARKLSRLVEFRYTPMTHEEDLHEQRTKLAVLGGGLLAGVGGLAFLAHSGKGDRAARATAQALKKMPVGRGTLERTAKFNAKIAERGYIHMKPMDTRQRRRFDKLPKQVQSDAGRLAKLAQHPGFTPGEKRGLRQTMGVFRKKYNFSAFVKDVAFKDLPRAVQKDISAFVKAGPGTLFSHYGMVAKELMHKADPHNMKMARANVGKLSHKAARNEVHDRKATKHILVNNDRIVDGHHFLAKAERGGVTGSLHVIDLTPSRFQLARRLAPIEFMSAAGGSMPCGVALRKRLERKGHHFARPLREILFYRQQLRDTKGDRFSNALYAAATNQEIYARTGPGQNDRINYGGAHGAIPLVHGQVLRGAYNQARTVHKWGGRGVNATRDIADVVGGRPRRVDYAGRPQKREWEKAYAKRGAETALIGAAGLGLVYAAKKNPALAEKIAFGPARRMRKKVNDFLPDILASRVFVRPVIELAADEDRAEARARREDREHKVRMASAITTIGAGSTVATGAALAGLKKWQGSGSKKFALLKTLLKGAYKTGKIRGGLGQRFGFVDPRRLTLFGVVRRRAALIGTGALAAGAGAGAATALLRNPGRPMRENEDVSGKLIYRRSNIPLIRHYGVGTGPAHVAHVQASTVRAPSKFKVEDTEKFAGGRKVYVERTTRRHTPEDISARVQKHNAAESRYNMIKNNCEIAGNTVLAPRRPTNQAHDAGKGALIGAGIGGLGVTAGLVVPRLAKRVRRLSVILRPRYFDEAAEVAGWDVRDPRGRSARVYAPGSRKRVRREKEWHEKEDNRRKIRLALVAAGVPALLGAGYLVGRKTKKVPLRVSPKSSASWDNPDQYPLFG